ncbi:rhamnulokinase [Prauserella alba]|uniref:rhamnulokinase n=1 Tax=Prauserella alba TaxID=176898 RepID=UPI0020A423DE|nr:rhamnulokinase family protein [Prauserella alba]
MSTAHGSVAAVDLGASGGRVMLGHVGEHELRLETVARFENEPVRTPDGLHWNILELYRRLREGVAEAAIRAPGLLSVGIDSWAVDYGLLRAGTLLGVPYHYRDSRTADGVRDVHAVAGPEELYRHNGLQHLPFNTLFQLAADRRTGLLDVADRVLLLPDLLAYWLTGVQVAERTNASTTGLLDPGGAWNQALMEQLDLDRSLFPTLVSPGDTIGETDAHDEHRIRVTAAGSHDTASAVAAVPAAEESFAYISCGTWSLVGVELDEPVLSEESRAAGFTNELGVDGRIRYLHNVTGLWLLSESVAHWRRSDPTVELSTLLAQAADVPPGRVPVFDTDDERFLPPGDMPTRIAAWLSERDLPVPGTRAEFVRCILESLADAYARTITTAEKLTGRSVPVVHVVGGGSRNTLLCRLTAERTGRPVIAGPVEATATGNVLVQARAAGLIHGGLDELRSLVRRTQNLKTHLPS